MKDKKGFTLIEVLVAIAILGIGFGVIFELFSGGLRSAKLSEDYLKATWYGKAKMEEVLSQKDFSEGSTEGTFDTQFSWKVDVTKVTPSLGQKEGEESDLPVDLYQVVLKVSWPSGKGERSLDMESLRAFEIKE